MLATPSPANDALKALMQLDPPWNRSRLEELAASVATKLRNYEVTKVDEGIFTVEHELNGTEAAILVADALQIAWQEGHKQGHKASEAIADMHAEAKRLGLD